MAYTLTDNPNVIRRDEDGAWIPTDPANVDYQTFVEWRNAGNLPTPYSGPMGSISPAPPAPPTPPMPPAPPEEPAGIPGI